VAEVDHRGLAHGPISGWIRRDTFSGILMFGGRNFEPAVRPRITMTFDGRIREEFAAAPGAFLRFVSVPFMDGGRPIEYVRVNIGAEPPVRVAVEQFDVSRTRPIFGFGDGWHELELNPRTGARWRWLSERGELPFRSPADTALTLHLEGESPLKYFSRASHLTVRSGERVVFRDVLSSDFSLTIPVPPLAGPLVLETDQTYVPAEHGWRRTADRRHLGLRIFRCELRLAR
jgi:hypothetical protein